MRVIPPIDITAGAFTRASAANYFNSSGLLTSAGNDVLRVTYNPLTLECEGVIYENAATNVVLYSRDLTNAAWTKTNTTAALDVTGLTGVGNSASSLLATSTNATTLQAITLASSTRVTSAYIKRLVGTGTISITGDNGVTWTDVTSLISSTAWTRVSIPAQIVTNPVVGFKIATSGDKIAVDIVQNETNILTSPIQTTTVATTRAADSMTVGMVSNIAEPYRGASTWNPVTAYNEGDLVSYTVATGNYRTYYRLIAGTTATAPNLDIDNWVDVGPHEIEYADATFAVGDVRVVSSVHRTYECLTAGAKTESPTTDITGWIDIGPTNKWAALDYLRNTGSNSVTPMVFLIRPGRRIDSIAALGLEGNNVLIQVFSNGQVQFTDLVTLANRRSTTWYEYFFGPFDLTKNYLSFDIPPYASATIAITIYGQDPLVACKALVLGSGVNIGHTQWSATSDVLNFSSVERDDFGNSTMVQRRNVPKTNQELVLEAPYINRVRKVRDELNATPAVWSGLDDASTDNEFEALLILGFYRNFSINMENPLVSTISLELEEV